MVVPGSSSRGRLFAAVGCVLLAGGGAVGAGATAAAAAPNSVASRSVQDQAFRVALQALAARAEEAGDRAAADVVRHWSFRRDPRRRYLFALPDAAPAKPVVFTDAALGDQLRQLRAQQAAALFELAGQLAAAGDAAESYRLLHEVLREQPEHTEARRILGMTERRGDAPSPRVVRTPHRAYGWAANQYWRVETDHFRIATNHSAEAAEELAATLERLHALWRQVYFDCWSSATALRARWAGRNELLGRGPKHEIVLFRDRDEYVRQLQAAEPQIAVSLGYYMHARRTSYFFAGDDQARPTWYHEATHQMLHETIRDAMHDTGDDNNFWAVEAAALYMESLTDHGDYFTVGGFDADRLQYARARGLSGDFWLPLAELAGLGRGDYYRHPELRKLYSQTAGLGHFLMDGHGGARRGAWLQLLTRLYLGRTAPQSLAELSGTPLEQLDAECLAFLQVHDDDLAFVNPPGAVHNLSLARTAVTDAGLAALAGHDQLQWLDLSFTAVGDQGVGALPASPALRRLILERTAVTDQVLPHLAEWRELEELDLSNTAVTDAGLPHLAKLVKLQTLWLTNARVTDAGIQALAGLTNLKFLDVGGTGVTDAGWQALRQKLPQLNARQE